MSRLRDYITQALERLDAVEAYLGSREGTQPTDPDGVGAWVSLRRNLESAKAELKDEG